MLNNILTYIIVWILFQPFSEINGQMVPFRPKRRGDHTATLINNKLYILGGYGNDVQGKEFFWLDFSVPFNTTQNLSWQDLSNVNLVPSHSDAASVSGGADNNTLFLYGGIDIIAAESVYTFDSQSDSWNIKKITGLPTGKHDLTGITDNNGKMYLWSGLNASYDVQNGMLILDTINLNWRIESSVSAPTPRPGYGATLLPNQKIIYMMGE